MRKYFFHHMLWAWAISFLVLLSITILCSPNMMLNQMFNDKLNAHVNIKWKLSQWITTREAVMLQKRSGPMWLRETLP